MTSIRTLLSFLVPLLLLGCGGSEPKNGLSIIAAPDPVIGTVNGAEKTWTFNTAAFYLVGDGSQIDITSQQLTVTVNGTVLYDKTAQIDPPIIIYDGEEYDFDNQTISSSLFTSGTLKITIRGIDAEGDQESDTEITLQ